MTATLALADRLARLERTVATLQQQQPGAESLQPNIMTVDPQGHVGVVLAGGITVPVTESDPPSEANAITFTRPDGTVAGRVFLDEIAGATATDLILEAASTDSIQPGEVLAKATRLTDEAALLLTDSRGHSSFLQLLSAQQLQLSIGLASLSFGGATSASAVVTHGIGRAPAVWCTFNGAPGLQLTLGADTITTTQFTMHGLASAGIAGSINVFWMALG